MALLIERRACFEPKSLTDIKKQFRFNSGTFEFVYERGERAGKLLDVLSDSSRGYSLVKEDTVNVEISGSSYVVDKFNVIKKVGSEDKKVGELEAQWNQTKVLEAVFLGASDWELPTIAAIVLGKV